MSNCECVSFDSAECARKRHWLAGEDACTCSCHDTESEDEYDGEGCDPDHECFEDVCVCKL